MDAWGGGGMTDRQLINPERDVFIKILLCSVLHHVENDIRTELP
jgi:hypothetical protein